MPRTALKLLRTGSVEYPKDGVAAVIRALAHVITRYDPYYVPVAGSPDEFALLDAPDAVQDIEAPGPDDEAWDVRCPARIVFVNLLYRTLSWASDVNDPAFVPQVENDRPLPASTTDGLVQELDDGERVRYPFGHFDAYRGEPFEILDEHERDFSCVTQAIDWRSIIRQRPAADAVATDRVGSSSLRQPIRSLSGSDVLVD